MVDEYSVLIGNLRSLLNESPVDYRKIADLLYVAPFDKVLLMEKVAPLLTAHLTKVGFAEYEQKYLETNRLEGIYGLQRTHCDDLEDLEGTVSWYVQMLLNGYSGIGRPHYMSCCYPLYPSDGLLEASSLYSVHATYQSGDSFGTYPGQECLVAVIQGFPQLTRFLETLSNRDENRMRSRDPDDPEYEYLYMLGLHNMKEWEGYFERLDGFHVRIVYGVEK